jgi:arginine kinase
MEGKVKGQLSSMDGELKGTYYPLTGMDKATQQQLIDDHFLFKEGDRYRYGNLGVVYCNFRKNNLG